MNVLLDTHVFIWLDSVPERLSDKALVVCQDQNNALYLSMASVWEMQIKQQLGKLNLKLPLKRLIEEQCANNGLQILPIAIHHIYALNELPLHHNDPFDRLILAQSKLEKLHLASADTIFNRYDVDLIWLV
jgi:PIN domain nuclease of toxin-antitoxin system